MGRPRRSPLAALLAALLAAPLAGCATRQEVGLPVVYGGRVDLRPAPADPVAGAALEAEAPYAAHWQTVADDFGARPATPASPSPARQRLAARAAEVGAPTRLEPEPCLAIPSQRAAQAARPKGQKTGKDTAQLAREHYLDYPTHIKAQKITLVCPAEFFPRVHFTAGHLDRSRPGRVRGQGDARLLLGELTLEAEQLTWRAQEAGSMDVQILARGDVHMVSHVRGNVHRETGIVGLVITNDQLIPLR